MRSRQSITAHSRSPRSRTVVTPDLRCAASASSMTVTSSASLNSGIRSRASGPLSQQRWTCIDQPGQKRRAGELKQLAPRRQLGASRVHRANLPPLHDHDRAVGQEVLTVENRIDLDSDHARSGAEICAPEQASAATHMQPQPRDSTRILGSSMTSSGSGCVHISFRRPSRAVVACSAREE